MKAPDLQTRIDVPPRTRVPKGKDEWGFGLGTQNSFLIRALEATGKTREEIQSEYNAHFHPDLSYAEAKRNSGFGVFFSDCKRPVGTYHGSRSLLILEDPDGRLRLDGERAALVKAAIARDVLASLRGLRSKAEKDEVRRSFDLPTEL